MTSLSSKATVTAARVQGWTTTITGLAEWHLWRVSSATSPLLHGTNWYRYGPPRHFLNGRMHIEQLWSNDAEFGQRSVPSNRNPETSAFTHVEPSRQSWLPKNCAAKLDGVTWHG